PGTGLPHSERHKIRRSHQTRFQEKWNARSLGVVVRPGTGARKNAIRLALGACLAIRGIAGQRTDSGKARGRLQGTFGVSSISSERTCLWFSSLRPALSDPGKKHWPAAGVLKNCPAIQKLDSISSALFLHAGKF